MARTRSLSSTLLHFSVSTLDRASHGNSASPLNKITVSEVKLLPLAEMAATPKKRKVASECRRFQTRWENEYFFKQINRKCVCLICNENVAVMKEYNVHRHYETKHQSYASYTDAKRTQKFNSFFFVLTKYRKMPQQQAMKSLNLLPSTANRSQTVIS